MTEKATLEVQAASPDGAEPVEEQLKTTVNGDEALDWLRAHGTSGHFADDAERMRRLRARIDRRIIPFLALAYCANFLDKITINYANVMGITDDLGISVDQFATAASAFWIAVLLAELPSIYFLQRMPVGKWLAGCLGGWAISTACTAAATSYGGLLTARIFSGIFEAGIPPALMLICGQWYTRPEQVLRFVWWYMGTAGGFIVGGFLSWCFQHISPTNAVNGWQTMYIILGLLTLVLAAATWLLVPDTPMDCTFLDDQEKVSLLEHIKGNQTGVENRKYFSLPQLKEAFLDFQLWCQWLIMLLSGGGGGVITTFSATLIASFGYTPRQSALLSMGNGAVSITTCLLTSYGVRLFGHRWLFVILLTLPAILGAALMAYLPPANQAGCLAGIMLVNCIMAAVPIQFGWVTSNVAGKTKRSVASAVLNAMFAIGNIIGPKTFTEESAPAFTPAKITFFTFLCLILLLAVLLFIYYRLINNSRDKKAGASEGEVDETLAFSDLSDKENKHFRYVY